MLFLKSPNVLVDRYAAVNTTTVGMHGQDVLLIKGSLVWQR